MASRVAHFGLQAQHGINSLLAKRNLSGLNVLTLFSISDLQTHVAPEVAAAFQVWVAELSFLVNQQSSAFWAEGLEAQFLSQRKVRAQKPSSKRASTMRRHFLALLEPGE